MSLTAALRSLMIWLISYLLSLIVQKTGLTGIIDIEATAETIGVVLTGVITGLVAYGVNKLGNKYPWINQVLSFGRSKTGAMFVPAGERSVLVIATASGVPTNVTSANSAGNHTNVTV